MEAIPMQILREAWGWAGMDLPVKPVYEESCASGDEVEYIGRGGMLLENWGLTLMDSFPRTFMTGTDSVFHPFNTALAT